MKRAQNQEYDPKAKRIDRDAACPHCSERAMVFQDGSICCLIEGGISFVPEQGDGELFEMRQAYLANTKTK